MFFIQNSSTLLTIVPRPTLRGGERQNWYLHIHKLLATTALLISGVDARIRPGAEFFSNKNTALKANAGLYAPKSLIENSFYYTLWWLKRSLVSPGGKKSPMYTTKLNWYKVLTHYWVQKRHSTRQFRTKINTNYHKLIAKQKKSTARTNYIISSPSKYKLNVKNPRTQFTHFWHRINTSEFEDLEFRNLTQYEVDGYRTKLRHWLGRSNNSWGANERHDFVNLNKAYKPIKDLKMGDLPLLNVDDRVLYGKLHERGSSLADEFKVPALYGRRQYLELKQWNYLDTMYLFPQDPEMGCRPIANRLQSPQPVIVNGRSLLPRVQNTLRNDQYSFIHQRVFRYSDSERKMQIFLKEDDELGENTDVVNENAEDEDLDADSEDLDADSEDLDAEDEVWGLLADEDLLLETTEFVYDIKTLQTWATYLNNNPRIVKLSNEEEGVEPLDNFFVEEMSGAYTFTNSEPEERLNCFETKNVEYQNGGDAEVSEDFNFCTNTVTSGLGERDVIDLYSMLEWRYLPLVSKLGLTAGLVDLQKNYQPSTTSLITRSVLKKEKPFGLGAVEDSLQIPTAQSEAPCFDTTELSTLLVKAANPYLQLKASAKLNKLYLPTTKILTSGELGKMVRVSTPDKKKIEFRLAILQKEISRLTSALAQNTPVMLGDLVSYLLMAINQQTISFFNSRKGGYLSYGALKSQWAFDNITFYKTSGGIDSTRVYSNNALESCVDSLPSTRYVINEPWVLGSPNANPGNQDEVELEESAVVGDTRQAPNTADVTQIIEMYEDYTPHYHGISHVFTTIIPNSRSTTRFKFLKRLKNWALTTPLNPLQVGTTKKPSTESFTPIQRRVVQNSFDAGTWIDSLLNVVYETPGKLNPGAFAKVEQVRWAKKVLVSNTKLAVKNYKLKYKAYENFGRNVITLYDKIKQVLRSLPRHQQKNLSVGAFSVALFRLLIFKEINEWTEHLKHWYQKHSYKKHKRIFYTLRRILPQLYKIAFYSTRVVGLYFQLKGKVNSKGGLRKRVFRAFHGRFGSSTLRTVFQYKFKQVWCKSGAIGLKTISMHRNTQYVPKEVIANRLADGNYKYSK